MPNKSNRPVKRYKAKGVVASVFQRTGKTNGQETTYETVSVQRPYKDAQGEWKYTESLRMNDIPEAIAVLERVYADLIEIRVQDGSTPSDRAPEEK